LRSAFFWPCLRRARKKLHFFVCKQSSPSPTIRRLHCAIPSAQEAYMKVSLVVLTAGDGAGRTIPITLPQFLVGRDPQCHLRPASALISKRHCAILTKGGKVVVRDFDSTNGTFINDNPVKGESALKHEDVLRVGPLSFRVVIEMTTPVNKPTPPPPKLAAAPASHDDESVAAMLLSLQDEGGEASVASESGDVPAGSTVMDMVALGTSPMGKTDEIDKEGKPEGKTGEPAKDGDKENQPTDKKDPAKSPDTRAAAAAILEKYTHRQRD